MFSGLNVILLEAEGSGPAAPGLVSLTLTGDWLTVEMLGTLINPRIYVSDTSGGPYTKVFDSPADPDDAVRVLANTDLNSVANISTAETGGRFLRGTTYYVVVTDTQDGAESEYSNELSFSMPDALLRGFPTSPPTVFPPSLIVELKARMTDGHHNCFVLGDSNMQQIDPTNSHPTGHSTSLHIALEELVGSCGSAVMGVGYVNQNYAADRDQLGQVPYQYAADFTRVVDADDSAVVAATFYTNEEYVGGDPHTEMLPGQWYKLPLAGTYPTGSGTSSSSYVISVTKASRLLPDLSVSAARVGYQYLIPTSDSGTLNTAVRLTNGSVLAYNSHTTPDTATQYGEITFPSNASTATRILQMHRQSVNYSSGIVYGGLTQWLAPEGTTGVAVSPLMMVGGASARRAATDLWTARLNHSDCIRSLFRFVLATETTLRNSVSFWFHYKQNDASDSAASVASDGTASGPASNTAAGYAQNIASMCEWLYDDWLAEGGSSADIFFIDGGYHPKAAEPYASLQPLQEQAIEDLIRTPTSDAVKRLIVVRGTQLTTPTEMTDLGWYRSSSDLGHMRQVGYQGFQRRQVDALFGTGSTIGIGIHRVGRSTRIGRVVRVG